MNSPNVILSRFIRMLDNESPLSEFVISGICNARGQEPVFQQSTVLRYKVIFLTYFHQRGLKKAPESLLGPVTSGS